MKLENWQIIGIVVGAFAAVILIDLAMHEEFQQKFPLLKTAQFGKFRAKEMVQQEMNVVVPAAPTFAPEDDGPLSEDD